MSATDFKNVQITDTEIGTICGRIVERYQQNELAIAPDNTYEISYNYLLDYAESIVTNNFADRELIVLAHVVYGWMPTILTIHHGINGQQQINLSKIQKILKDIRDNRTNDFLSDADALKKIANFTNKSFVGASKFLHFLFPETFAIWDSNINSVLKIRCTANNVNAFVIYQKAMSDALKTLSQNNQNIKLRDIENKLFNLGRQNGYHNDN
jgi:hypothetical protein